MASRSVGMRPAISRHIRRTITLSVAVPSGFSHTDTMDGGNAFRLLAPLLAAPHTSDGHTASAAAPPRNARLVDVISISVHPIRFQKAIRHGTRLRLWHGNVHGGIRDVQQAIFPSFHGSVPP